jgi:hypothetical protein
MSLVVIINWTFLVLKKFLLRKSTLSLARNEKSGHPSLRQKSAVGIRQLGYQMVRYHGETFPFRHSNDETDLTGDPFETSPSESELCSPNDISSSTEGSLESPGDYEVNGLLEEYSISTSTPMESPIGNGTTGSNDDRMDANNSDSHPPISKPSLQSILSQSPFPFSQSPWTSSLDPPLPIESLCDWETGDVSLLQQPWNTALPADINPSPPIESLCDWETGDVSLLQQPWNINLPADINPLPPIESLCDHVTGDASLLQQPSNIGLPADINPLPPIHLGQGVDTSMLDQILETLNSPSRQSCPTSRETTSLRDPETSRQGSPLSGIIYRSVSHPSLSTVAAM